MSTLFFHQILMGIIVSVISRFIIFHPYALNFINTEKKKKKGKIT